MASLRTAVHMAASTSGRFTTLSRPVVLRTGRVVSCPATFAPAASSSRVVVSPTGPAPEYAVIATPSGQQLVEEGKWFVLSSNAIQASVDDGQLRFPCVSVKRADGEFVKGKVASEYVVEAQLLDEQAFAVAAANSRPLALGKVLVTRILHSPSSMAIIEEALRA